MMMAEKRVVELAASNELLPAEMVKKDKKIESLNKEISKLSTQKEKVDKEVVELREKVEESFQKLSLFGDKDIV